MEDPERIIAVSIVSYWEIVIKAEKLRIADVPRWWEHRVSPYIDLQPSPSAKNT